MACYSPLQAYRLLDGTPKGSIVFSPSKAFPCFPLKLPCGQCIGCRLERSRQWAVRCVHEASLYEENCFITLTYSDEHLPKDGSLHVRDFQLFMKRLRKKYGSNIRFFHCGEYGERFGRPHFHAALFNFDFSDKVLLSERGGHRLYSSESLADLWPFGFHSIGSLTFESAAYVARYIMKKVTGEAAELHYLKVDPFTGEVASNDEGLLRRKPEYVTMSRRPGIGKGWLDMYMSDVYPSGKVRMNGVFFNPPRFYDSQYEIQFPSDFERLKSERKLNAKKFASDNTPDRLRVKKICKEAQISRLLRPLDLEI